MNSQDTIFIEDTYRDSSTKGKKLGVDVESTDTSVYLTIQNKEGEDHFTVAIDFFGGKLRAMVWQPEQQGNDAGTVVPCHRLEEVL